MSANRYAPPDVVKEPHPVSLKVLRLSRPSLATQNPIPPPPSTPGQELTQLAPPIPASLAYHSPEDSINPTPFLLAPILTLPPAFGSAYVGETFSCTLCANNEIQAAPADAPDDPLSAPTPTPFQGLSIRDVRIQAELKIPSDPQHPIKLDLSPPAGSESTASELPPGQTLQKNVTHDLKEEGQHVLGVTVSYHEASPTGGRTRTFRKLYQFQCKSALIVRTKTTSLPLQRRAIKGTDPGASWRRWILETQLENVSQDATLLLEQVQPNLEPGLKSRDYNWETSRSDKPLLRPGEVEQVYFVISQKREQQVAGEGKVGARGRVVFGTLGIGWRGEMGKRGYITTGKLGAHAGR